MEMETHIKLSALGTAHLTCPECRRNITLQASDYNLDKQLNPVKYTCTCSHTQAVVLEKRYAPQKDTFLAGTFLSGEPDVRYAGKMVIKRLNSEGLTLKINLEQHIPEGTVLIIEFVLDDAIQSMIKKEVRVLAGKGRYLTAEFLSKEHQDNLGAYLFFNKLFV